MESSRLNVFVFCHFLMFLTENSERACEIHWDPPINPQGEIISYNIYITFTRFTYSRPESCSNDFERIHERLVPVGGGNNYTFHGALPYAEYSVHVNARNGERIGNYARSDCYTLQSKLSSDFQQSGLFQ